MSTHDSAFVRAIQEKHLIRIDFTAADGEYRVRVCAPMDIGPQRRYADKTPRYHLWDYESSDGPHTLSMLPEQVGEFPVLEATFDPGEFVTWPPSWHVPRDWGAYSWRTRSPPIRNAVGCRPRAAAESDV